MGLIKEPKNVDFVVESKPWTDKELLEFRVIMNELKAKTLKKPSMLKKETEARLK